MFELLGLFLVFIIGGIVLGVVALLIGVFKLLFKLVTIPLSLGFTALKGLLVLILGLLGLLIVGPVVLAIGLAILLPILLIGAVVWAGVAIFSAA
jgi:hypothetical protein